MSSIVDTTEKKQHARYDISIQCIYSVYSVYIYILYWYLKIHPTKP